MRSQIVHYEMYNGADDNSYDFNRIEPAQQEEKWYMDWEVDGFADGNIFN